jgi:hypothetical protein
VPPRPAAMAAPAKARRVILKLSLIGENLDQAGRLHARQF